MHHAHALHLRGGGVLGRARNSGNIFKCTILVIFLGQVLLEAEKVLGYNGVNEDRVIRKRRRASWVSSKFGWL